MPAFSVSSVAGEEKAIRSVEKDEIDGTTPVAAGDETNAVQDAMIEMMDRMGISGEEGGENGKDDDSEGEMEQKTGEEMIR